MPPCNIHGTAVLLGDRGVLVTGPSGAGKTALALALVSRFSAQGLFCRLVGDDQLFVAGHDARLVCRAPGTIAGLAEVYGIGPQKLAFEPAAVIDLVVRLVPAAGMHRFQEDATETIAGCVVPRLDLPARDAFSALPAVAARLGLPPFGKTEAF